MKTNKKKTKKTSLPWKDNEQFMEFVALEKEKAYWLLESKAEDPLMIVLPYFTYIVEIYSNRPSYSILLPMFITSAVEDAMRQTDRLKQKLELWRVIFTINIFASINPKIQGMDAMLQPLAIVPLYHILWKEFCHSTE